MAGARRRLPRPSGFGWACLVAVVGLIPLERSSPGRDGVLVASVVLTLVAVLVVGALWSFAAVAVARVDAVSASTDATVGGHATVALRVRSGEWNTGLRITGWSASGADRPDDTVASGDGPDVGLRTDGTTVVRLPTPARGLITELRLVVEGVSPFDTFRSRRVVTVALPSPIAVAPVPTAIEVPLTALPETGDLQLAALPGGDVVRSVRPYRVGDPAHLVHWPTSARVGELVVREIEPPARPGLVVVVEFTESTPATEAEIAEAAGAVLAVLGAGGTVVLCTRERGTARHTAVRTRIELDRRLAAAEPGPVTRPRRAAHDPTPELRFGS